MVQQNVKERRKHVRATRILSVQFRLTKSRKIESAGSWELSTTQNVSPEGISFYSSREFRAGDILDLHIIMSGILDVYKGYGRVIRIERKKSGVCYLAAVKFIDKEQVNKDIRTRHRSVKRTRAQKRL